MTSHERYTSSDDEGTRNHRAKRRKGPKACDVCRRKKIRCDPDPSGDAEQPCVNCAVFKTECTYTYIAKKRRTQQAYIDSLQNRLNRAERLLATLAPDLDLSKELDDGSEFSQILSSSRIDSLAQRQPRPPSPPKPVPRPAHPNVEPGQVLAAFNQWRENDSSDEEDDDDSLAFIPLPPQPNSPVHGHTPRTLPHRFHGKSSGVVLIRKVIGMKRDYIGSDEPPVDPVHLTHDPWEANLNQSLPAVHFTFPTTDLLEHLIETFFLRINSNLPILHRPSFEGCVRDGLHTRDAPFGAVVLLVCAAASRWSHDPRVLPQPSQDADTKPSWISAGWDFYFQVHARYRRNFLHTTSVVDLQLIALGCLYLQGTMHNSPSWQMAGLGLRLALDVGAHRRNRPESDCKIETELWKRVFWVLVVLDRVGSSALGRPCAIWEEDIDLDLPLEVDDEYMTDDQEFKQPPDKPSRVAAFNSIVKLSQVLIGALRTIYPVSKSKRLCRIVGSNWEQDMVAALDSSLNDWVERLPEHLRWDPNRQTPDFAFTQTVFLHTMYSYVQIVVHRPYITSSRKSSLAFPSLAICTNAARSCSHILDAQMRRGGDVMIPTLNVAAFTSAIVLLFNIWGTNKTGARVDWQTQVQDVHICMRFIKKTATRWGHALKMGGILHDLVSVGDFPLPQSCSPPAFPAGQKRSRDSDEAVDSVQSTPALTNTSSITDAGGSLPHGIVYDGSDFSEPHEFKQEPLAFTEQSYIRSAQSSNSLIMEHLSLSNRPRNRPEPGSASQPNVVPNVYPFLQQPPESRMDAPDADNVLNALDSAYFDGATTLEDSVVMDSFDMWGTARNGYQWDEWQQFTNTVPSTSGTGYPQGTGEQVESWTQF